MKRFAKTLAVALSGASFVVSFAADAQACGGRGGGGGGYRPVAYRPAYSQPYCHTQPYQQPYQQPYYPQQQFAQPQFPQQPFAQPGFPAGQGMSVQVHGSQPVQQPVQQVQQQQVQQVQQVQTQQFQGQPAGASAVAALGGGQQSMPVAQQGVQGAPVARQGMSGPQTSQVSLQGQAAPLNAAAPQGNQGQVGQQPQVQQQPSVQQPIAQQPVQQQPVSQEPVQQAPVQGQPTDAQPSQSVEMSALEALAGLGGAAAPIEQPQVSQQPEAASAQPSGPMGDFVAKLPNGATVRLSLNEDGSFRWAAVANGKTSEFSGRFVLQNGSLQLVRNSDNQKLEGSLTEKQGGFNLRLSGQSDSGLDFVRG